MITWVTPAGIEGTEDGQPLKLTRELHIDSPRTSESNPQHLSFPQEVGKRWQYRTDWVFKPKGSKGRHVVEVVVT